MDFDRQAEGFERRAGLPAAACAEIVAGILALTEPGSGDLLLEIGAGTGQLGRGLAERTRYLGLDASGPMLARFRGASRGHLPGLVQADAAGRWPLTDGSVRIVFGSRVLHLLNPEHVAGETARVAVRGGAWLLIGEVRRDPDGVRARLRALLHQLLVRHGYQPRARKPIHAAILAASTALGAHPLDARTLSRWTVSAAPGESIAAWRLKPGLAGIALPAEVQKELLDELEDRARRQFARLEQPVESVENYRLQGARFG